MDICNFFFFIFKVLAFQAFFCLFVVTTGWVVNYYSNTLAVSYCEKSTPSVNQSIGHSISISVNRSMNQNQSNKTNQ